MSDASQKIPSFTRGGHDRLADVQSLMNSEGYLLNLRRQEILFEQGDAVDAMYWLESGAIWLTSIDSAGQCRARLAVGPQLLTDVEPLLQLPHSERAEALVPVRVWKLPRAAFISIMNNMKFLAVWVESLARQLHHQRLYEQTTSTPIERVETMARFLKGQELQGIRLTQEQLAALAGTSRRTVARALQRLREKSR